MKQALYSFNRGKVSSLSLARTDQKRVSLSAETMTNWIPRIMGPMSLRPGMQYLHSTHNNSAARYLRFVFSTNDVALIELTSYLMRVVVSDSLITRPSVSTSVLNGGMSNPLNNWTDNDEAGALSEWSSGMRLTGNNNNYAIRDQTVSVSIADRGVAHALRIRITFGPVILKVGSTTGGDDYISETQLGTGYHSLSFTPTGNFNIRFMNNLKIPVTVESCQIESSGIMTISTPWSETELSGLSFDQSGDIIFVAGENYRQQKIERRSSTSWSIVDYLPDDGPFLIENTSPITLIPSFVSGSVTLGSSKPYFKSTNVGSLFRISSIGQTVREIIATGDFFTDAIQVTGTGDSRIISISALDAPNRVNVTGAANNGVGLIRITAISHGRTTGDTAVVSDVGGTTEANGTWVITKITNDTLDLQGSTFVHAYTSGGKIGIRAATKTLQISYDSEFGPWSDVSGKTWISDASENYNDALTNQIVWYRIGVKAGNYFSGSSSVELSVGTGSKTGVVMVTAYGSTTSVTGIVVKTLGNYSATNTWAEGLWSSRRGWPSSVAFHDGRLWWAGKERIVGSISDDYYGFDPDYIGDAGPINRTIGGKTVDSVNWLLSLQRLIIGGQAAEYSCRASSLDEPLTPTAFAIRPSSTQGSATVDAIQIDQHGIYVQRGGSRIYELSFDGNSYDYGSVDITTLIPEIGSPGIIRMAAQRQPDTRIHCVRSDGTVALAVFDRAEDVLAWVDITTDGFIEDVVVLPGTGAEDRVYYVVRRTISGSTVRYLEKWALDTECAGGVLNKQADSFITYTGAATTTITGLSHLEGKSVVVWANGADLGTTSSYAQTYTVSGGQIVLPAAYTNVVVGLPYTAQWKSSKLASQADAVVEAFDQDKRVAKIGLILANTHAKGLRFGPDFSTLDSMPDIESGKLVTSGTIHTTYAETAIEFPGRWAVDSRICLQAQAPRPCTVMAAIPDIKVAR